MSKHINKPAGETRRYVGIDLGDRKSRLCIVDEQGSIVLQEWVVTTPEALLKTLQQGSCHAHRDGGGDALPVGQRTVGEVRA